MTLPGAGHVPQLLLTVVGHINTIDTSTHFSGTEEACSTMNEKEEDRCVRAQILSRVWPFESLNRIAC